MVSTGNESCRSTYRSKSKPNSKFRIKRTGEYDEIDMLRWGSYR